MPASQANLQNETSVPNLSRVVRVLEIRLEKRRPIAAVHAVNAVIPTTTQGASDAAAPPNQLRPKAGRTGRRRFRHQR